MICTEKFGDDLILWPVARIRRVQDMDMEALANGLLELEPGFWGTTEEGSVSYPEHGHLSYLELEDNSYWFRHRNACLVSIVERFPPDGPIADVGGGNGFVSLGLRDAGFDTLLVEPGADGARNGFMRGLRPVVHATFENAKFKPQSLPAIGLFDVVEHIEEDAAFLSALRTALRPQGLVYLTVPAFGWLWSPEDVEAGHFRRYTRRSLAEALEVAGFRVEFASYFFWLLPIPIFLMRSIAGRLGIRRTDSQERRLREHQTPGGAGGTLLDRLLALELFRLQKGRGIPFGSSILAVARKQ
jgi:SAM-dependent methyltransferase